MYSTYLPLPQIRFDTCRIMAEYLHISCPTTDNDNDKMPQIFHF